MRVFVSCAALALLAACGPEAAQTPETPKAVAAAAKPPNAATLKAAVVEAERDLDQDAASVNKVVMLQRGDAKLYSTVGGDPAINGEYVFLAIIDNPHEGWKVFRIGDFNSWELVEQTADRAVLSVSHSAVEEGTGEIVTYEQRIAVAVPAFAATQVQVTPVD